MCLPWTFFDGRVFHRNLQKADSCRNLIELCDGRMNMVYAIEAMRSAILHGLVHEFAVPGHMPFHFPGGAQGSGNPAAMAAAAAAAMAAAQAAGRGPMGPGGMRMQRNGGHLVVGGQVVGQWGPNHGPKGNKNGSKKKVRRLHTCVKSKALNECLL